MLKIRILAIISFVLFSSLCFSEEQPGLENLLRQQHIDFEKCNVDGVTSLHANGSALFGIGWKGNSKELLENLMKDICKNGENSVKITDYAINGNLALIKWKNKENGQVGADTILFKDKKIINQSVTWFFLKDLN